MNHPIFKIVTVIIIYLSVSLSVYSQDIFVITGRVTDADKQPLQNTSIHLAGIPGGTMTKSDGSFAIRTAKWSDTIELTNTGFEKLKVALKKDETTNLNLQMKAKAERLQNVVVSAKMMDKEPGKRFMKKVIANKIYNNPDRFSSYSYQQYKRHELDISNLDTAKTNSKGLKNLTLNIYRSTDSTNAKSSILPLYFSETISNNYHNLSPSVEKENILAKKTLGLETDKLLRKLDKFNFSFNIYDNWFPIFSQTYASPLSTTAFDYYNFYFSDSSMVNGKKVYRIHFSPKQSFERAFTGSLWINDSTYSIKKIDMHLSKSANLNFINDIHYTQEYNLSLDSATKKYEYMPYKYASVVDFETGTALLGIPVRTNTKSVRLVVSNTTVIDHIKVNATMPDNVAIAKMNKEATADIEKPESYWKQNRSDSLSIHEKSIFLMVDSLKKNSVYKRDTKIITALSIGYWDFGNKIRMGPLTSLASTNITEGLRSRVGFWTLPGISKKLNINGYMAYGTRDNKLKGGLGLKYLWNPVRWSKTSIFAGSDYDYLLEKEEELDDDNLLTSMLRKNIPATSIFIKSITLKHEQLIAKDLTLKAAIDYKELTPAFNFAYHPISKITDLPIDSVYANRLPVAEASIGFRYSKNERYRILNYDQVKLSTYNPVFTFNYTYGLDAGKAEFSFNKINAGIEQKLRLPPKSIFYYNINVGRTFGTAPYLLLNVPPGNESNVDSRYYFNTMLPYEFASDQYVNLHSRLYLGGVIFDKIPLLNKMGLRERLSFNMHMGSMTAANRTYNSNAHFFVTGNSPFKEAGVGIENIFHLLSVDYFWRLSNYTNSVQPKGGLFLGMKMAF
ncbi:MAG: hypothetical protein JWQ09_930 [Segetibacter sp.]|nr:hypothetical protein [Segetibacter sp.]